MVEGDVDLWNSLMNGNEDDQVPLDEDLFSEPLRQPVDLNLSAADVNEMISREAGAAPSTTTELAYITKHRAGKWDEVARKNGGWIGGKSCRLRWKDQLHPRLKMEPFTVQEKEYLVHLRKQYDNKWSLIASHLPGRKDNVVKNICNSLRKRKTKGHMEDYIQQRHHCRRFFCHRYASSGGRTCFILA
ncbi:Transcription factor MYB32 [Platanthera guangdongensis]|uniref:Transcription factor MYB32 n=1 Tax=Platanthera guangdongensis TaxID=2320717 RepID=A0ABR2LQ19_9ASPA